MNGKGRRRRRLCRQKCPKISHTKWISLRFKFKWQKREEKNSEISFPLRFHVCKGAREMCFIKNQVRIEWNYVKNIVGEDAKRKRRRQNERERFLQKHEWDSEKRSATNNEINYSQTLKAFPKRAPFIKKASNEKKNRIRWEKWERENENEKRTLNDFPPQWFRNERFTRSSFFFLFSPPMQ